MSLKVGVIAPLTGDYNYFGIPIHNGAVLALQEACAAGDDLEIVPRTMAVGPHGLVSAWRSSIGKASSPSSDRSSHTVLPSGPLRRRLVSCPS
jgi:hypothetical protein